MAMVCHHLFLPLLMLKLSQMWGACRRCGFLDLSLSSITTAIASHCLVPSIWLPQLC